MNNLEDKKNFSIKTNQEMLQIPCVLALRDKDGLTFYCDYCKTWHRHGVGLGHRVAHCTSDDSPYSKRGYFLVSMGDDVVYGEKKELPMEEEIQLSNGQQLLEV